MAASWQRLFALKAENNEGTGDRDRVRAPRALGPAPSSNKVPLSDIPKANRNSPSPTETNRIFDAIGHRNEDLRNRFREICAVFDNFERARSVFEAALDPVEMVLRESQEVKSALHEADTRNAALMLQNEKMQREMAGLVREREMAVGQRDHLAGQLAETQDSLSTAERLLGETRAVAGEKTARLAKLEEDLEEKTRSLSRSADELRIMRETSDEREGILLDLQSLRASLTDQLASSRDENAALRARVEEVVGVQSTLKARVAEYEMVIETLQKRSAELEGALAVETAAHARLKAASKEEAEKLRAQIDSLETELSLVKARSGSAERALNETRQQLREKMSDIQSLDTRLLDSKVAEQASSQRLEELSRDLTDMKAKLSEMEASRSALAERAMVLATSSKAKAATVRNQEQKIASLEARVNELTALTNALKVENVSKVAALEEKLLSVNVARSLAEGALQSARAELTSIRREAATSHVDSHAQSDPSDDDEVVGEKVLRMPRA